MSQVTKAILLDETGQEIVEQLQRLSCSEWRTSALIGWNNEIFAGTVTPNVTLPTPSGNKAEAITYMFTAASATASFTAPSGWILCKDDGTAGLSTGNTIVFTDLMEGSIYEVSFKPVSTTVIRLVILQTLTA